MTRVAVLLGALLAGAAANHLNEYGCPCDAGLRCVEEGPLSLCLTPEEFYCRLTTCGDTQVCAYDESRECGPNERCLPTVCVNNPCLTVRCSAGFECTFNPLEKCEEGLTCPRAQCTPIEEQYNPCAAVTCLEGTVCVPEKKSARCITDPCIATTCPFGTACKFDPTIKCEDNGFPCVQTECVEVQIEDPCSYTTCPEGELCIFDPDQECDGPLPCPVTRCILPPKENPCNLVDCIEGDVCIVENEEAKCITNPCSFTTCLQGTQCIFDPTIKCEDDGFPCVQTRCEPIEETRACDQDVCGAEEVCINVRRECFTTPCPQYDCLPKADCEATEICTMEYAPVCGSDGITYPNFCNLRGKVCATKTMIYVDYEGACEEPPVTGECDYMILCTDEFIPVCGTDGKTYRNECLLKSARCDAEHNPDLEVEHQGICRPRYCPKVCPLLLRPVCGNNGNTYANECELFRDSCATNVNLFALHDGPCVEKDCDMPCLFEEKPICGTDGVQYLNKCALEVAKCKARVANQAVPDVANYGECPRCPTICPLTPAPVCGAANGKIYTLNNQCVLDFFRCYFSSDLTYLHDGLCTVEDCPRDYEPVCANNGKTYHNECQLEIAQYYNRFLQKRHDGRCRRWHY